MTIQRTRFAYPAILFLLAVLAVSEAVLAQPPAETPDALIRRLSGEILGAIHADKGSGTGDERRLADLADQRLMPHVDLGRLTSLAVGRHWRRASPEQKTGLQDGVRRLLLQRYAKALAEGHGRNLVVKPLRGDIVDFGAVVRTEFAGSGEPVLLAYRMENTGTGWKILDLNLRGEWLVERLRPRFANEIETRGMDSLLAALRTGEPIGKDRLRKVRLSTSMGAIVVVLDEDGAPGASANFLAYVQSGYYDGTRFHRVIGNRLIQGGGYDGNMVEKPTGMAVARPSPRGYKNNRGTVAMARASDPLSGTAQFYINVDRNSELDEQTGSDGIVYSAFGEVVDGMAVAARISGLPTGIVGRHKNVPLEPVLIERAELLPPEDP